MRLQRTYYEIMGLSKTATPQEIKAKYYELARQFHPDRAQDKVLAERLFVQINLAYKTLTDVNKRAVYDSSLIQADTAKANGPRSSAAPQVKPAAPAPAAPAQRPPVNVVEAMQRANGLYMGGDRIAAHKLCMDVLRVDPTNTEAHQLVGDIYADQGRRQEALDEYKKAAETGGATRLLQEKIARMQSLAAQQQQPLSNNVSGPNAGVNGAARNRSQAAARGGTPEPPKKGSLLDRLIGKTR